jgi:hypothetical protein
MPLTTLPILTISPTLPAPALQELKKIFCIVTQGAFGGQSDWQIVLTDQATHTMLMIEHTYEVVPHVTADVAVRLASTMLQLLTTLARKLGVSIRQTNLPCCPMLPLSGLTWHRVRLCLSRLVATLQSIMFLELACASTGFRLRIRTGQSLGYAAPAPAYLCSAVIRRRVTSRGEVVRIRCGHRLMSIAIPRDISATAITNGALISTAPVVGVIVRQMVKISPCQTHLFERETDQNS